MVNCDVSIHSDSRAALAALSKVEVTSREVRACRSALDLLAGRCKVKLKWVRGHAGIRGNEKADRLAKRGAAGLRANGVNVAASSCVVEARIREWTAREVRRRWQLCQGCRHTKAFLEKGLPGSWAKEMLNLNKRDLRTVVEWVTGHGDLLRFKKLTGKGIEEKCRLCGESEETPLHLLCHCPRAMGARRRVCGEFLLEPADIRALSLGSLLGLIGLIKGLIGSV